MKLKLHFLERKQEKARISSQKHLCNDSKEIKGEYYSLNLKWSHRLMFWPPVFGSIFSDMDPFKSEAQLAEAWP